MDKLNKQSNTQIALTEEEHNARALQLDSTATVTLFNFFVALKEINDNKYYHRLGATSMAEYCKRKFDMASSSVSEYLKIANKLLLVSDTNTSLDSEAEKFRRAELFQLPIRKLVIISQLEPKQISRLVEDGTLQLKSKTFTMEDIKEMDRDSFRKLVSGKQRVEIKKEAETKDVIPFEKVYANAEKYLFKLITEIRKSDLISSEHKKEIEKRLTSAAQIYDMYKPAD
jgi:hypothetical protein